ncbi:MAG: AAA family ATPase, partial [Spirochaetia bacterium]|nr:AAA family ATPase [Spirochaetia bacterium]
RSRIKGYGYEIYTKTSMPVNPKNTEKMIHFIAGEVQNDGRIPHFEKSGIIEILNQAVIRARPGFYTLRLRELGGLIRTAGDVAAREKVKFVNETHVIQALEYTKSIESAFQEEEEV